MYMGHGAHAYVGGCPWGIQYETRPLLSLPESQEATSKPPQYKKRPLISLNEFKEVILILWMNSKMSLLGHDESKEVTSQHQRIQRGHALLRLNESKEVNPQPQ